eukprot:CAMPEP_0194372094 /NCGR_PEP_ID=MMETSP0174-20130528/20390_1 /TAXON_ID=216777 /ORGANISM="Proboscia alata, Strain PI-D3" /LENGTH=236 /DNA_ID=CAMNT_0039150393 /DNA_START=63 /DNA_END=773 /DNA_ORIENTATION=+
MVFGHYPQINASIVTKLFFAAIVISISTKSIHSLKTSPPLARSDQIIDFASSQGITLTITTLGPAYRAIAKSSHLADLDNDDEDDAWNKNILGYCEGFIRPVGSILHLDKMEVYSTMTRRARKANGKFKGGGTQFGVGLLLGNLCLRHGIDNGCKFAEFLAIDDAEYQHKRLVRYYKALGLKEVRYVGEDIKDIPDRMVWGGCGTLMKAELDFLLAKWTPEFITEDGSVRITAKKD